jgi:hypothetical protein
MKEIYTELLKISDPHMVLFSTNYLLSIFAGVHAYLTSVAASIKFISESFFFQVNQKRE